MTDSRRSGSFVADDDRTVRECVRALLGLGHGGPVTGARSTSPVGVPA